MVSTQNSADATAIVLSPNCSANWPQCKRLLALLALPVGLIALGFGLAGAVLVPPFAGLEFGALALCLRHVCRQARRREVITLDAERIVVAAGRTAPEHVTTLKRRYTHLVVRDPEHPFGKLELTLSQAGGRRTAVGTFLNHGDRHRLRETLLDAGLPEIRNRWWLNDAGRSPGPF